MMDTIRGSTEGGKEYNSNTEMDTSHDTEPAELNMPPGQSVVHDQEAVMSPDSGVPINEDATVESTTPAGEHLCDADSSLPVGTHDLSKNEQIQQTIDESNCQLVNQDEHLTLREDANWTEVESLLASVSVGQETPPSQDSEHRCDTNSESPGAEDAMSDTALDIIDMPQSETGAENVNTAKSTLSGDKTDSQEHVTLEPDHVTPEPDHLTPEPDHLTPEPDHVTPTHDQTPQIEHIHSSSESQNIRSAQQSEVANQNREQSLVTQSCSTSEPDSPQTRTLPSEDSASEDDDVDHDEDDVLAHDDDEDDQDASLSYDIDDISDALSDNSIADVTDFVDTAENVQPAETEHDKTTGAEETQQEIDSHTLPVSDNSIAETSEVIQQATESPDSVEAEPSGERQEIDSCTDKLSDSCHSDTANAGVIEILKPADTQHDSLDHVETAHDKDEATEDMQQDMDSHTDANSSNASKTTDHCVNLDTKESSNHGNTVTSANTEEPDKLVSVDGSAPDTVRNGDHTNGSTPGGEEESAWRRIENLDLESVLRQFDKTLEGEHVDGTFPVDCFEEISIQAEKRLAARRAARQEAREIRMREIERQRKEDEEKEKAKASLNSQRSSTPSTSSRYSARQDSEEVDDLRTLKRELNAAEEKFTKAMMDNASLDNEKQMLRYEVDLLKDKLDDLQEEHTELQRQHRDKNRTLEQTKRDNKNLTDEVGYLKQQIQLRDNLIEEYGLVFISNDTLADEEAGGEGRRREPADDPGAPALVTPQASEILKKHSGNLDERLTKFDDEHKSLVDEIKKLRLQLEQEKERSALAEKYSTPRVSQVSNGPDVSEIQMESQRQLNDYKFKLKKAEQDKTTLEGTVSRLESQVKRYKQSAENSEKNEEDLKGEKRKLLRELREAQNQIEELQTNNQHLVRRIEKMKSARNAILNS